MKKNNLVKILVFTVAVAVILSVMLASCGNDEKAITGKWRSDNEIGVLMTFDFKTNNEVEIYMSSNEADGLGMAEELIGNGKYTLVDGKVELFELSGNPEALNFKSEADSLSEETTVIYNYKISGDKLILYADGDDENIFKKVK